MTGYLETLDPLDLELETGGRRVRDLRSPEECASAIMKLDMEIESIISQIAHSEADPSRSAPGWRTRAQTAIRWKKRTRRAVQTLAIALRPARPALADKRQAILDTIEREIGNEEFERLVELTKERNPHLPWGAT